MTLSYPPDEKELAAYARAWADRNKADEPPEVIDDFVRDYAEVFAGSIPPTPGEFWREYA